jgi:hypothetical protein
MGIRTFVILVGIALGAAVFAPPAHAGSDAAPTTTPTTAAPVTTATPPGVGIGDGYYFTGAVITTPGAANRTLNAYQAATFVQSWLGEAVWGQPTMQNPPADLPVSQVDISGEWAAGGVGVLTVYFVSDGNGHSWINFPQNQVPTTATTTPPAPEKWWIPPPHAIDAFNGTGKLEETLGTYTATSVTTPTPATGSAASSSSGSSGSSNLWIWAVVGSIGIVLIGAGIVIRSRRTPAPQ